MRVSVIIGSRTFPSYSSFVCSRILIKISRLPFFFEPNFDALIEPLPAALRIQEEDKAIRKLVEPVKMYKPIVYGDFLLRKVGSNFDTSKGRYDAD